MKEPKSCWRLVSKIVLDRRAIWGEVLLCQHLSSYLVLPPTPTPSAYWPGFLLVPGCFCVHQSPSPVSGDPPIADSGNPDCFSEPWARKPSGSQLRGLLVLLGFAKACGSCLTPLLSLPPIPLPPAPQGWCHQGWHSASQLWNTGQWLHQSWAICAVFSLFGDAGSHATLPDKFDHTGCYALHCVSPRKLHGQRSWQATVHGVAKSGTKLSKWACMHTNQHTETIPPM